MTDSNSYTDSDAYIAVRSVGGIKGIQSTVLQIATSNTQYADFFKSAGKYPIVNHVVNAGRIAIATFENGVDGLAKESVVVGCGYGGAAAGGFLGTVLVPPGFQFIRKKLWNSPWL